MGDRITHRFGIVANLIYLLEWYSLASKMQRNMPTFIALSQKKVYLEGIAGARCTCEVFKEV